MKKCYGFINYKLKTPDVSLAVLVLNDGDGKQSHKPKANVKFTTCAVLLHTLFIHLQNKKQ